jgi:hypothetical protein
MRFILGIIIGCAITVGAAYVVDATSSSGPDAKQMVNWDVVAKRLEMSSQAKTPQLAEA